MIKLVVLVFLFHLNAQGKDFGVKGATFPILEEGFVAMIQRKLANVDIAKAQKHMQEQAKKSLEKPKGLYLPRAKKEYSYLVDPTFELKEDVLLPDGELLYPKGTKVNPLEHMRLDKKLILLNGEDKEQIKWLKNSNIAENDVVILTIGSPIDLSQKLGRTVYFDQFKQFTQKFKVKHLPAIICEENNLIRVVICQI